MVCHQRTQAVACLISPDATDHYIFAPPGQGLRYLDISSPQVQLWGMLLGDWREIPGAYTSFSLQVGFEADEEAESDPNKIRLTGMALMKPGMQTLSARGVAEGGYDGMEPRHDALSSLQLLAALQTAAWNWQR